MSLPIYIVGDNPLAYYMGAQLQTAGNRVIILLNDPNSLGKDLSTDGISIKEDRFLSQKHHRLDTAILMKEQALMIVITSFDKINTTLSNISIKQINNAPVLCFSPLKDLNCLQELLGNNLHPAFFDGFLQYQNNTISVFGSSNHITICPPSLKDVDDAIINSFDNTKFELSISDNHNQSFWQYFAPYAIGSIFSAAGNKKLSKLLKDKQNKETIKVLSQEFCNLATADDVIINEESIIKEVYNIPANYTYPLHGAIQANQKTEFDLLTSIIQSTAHKNNILIPQTRELLKKLYTVILNYNNPNID